MAGLVQQACPRRVASRCIHAANGTRASSAWIDTGPAALPFDWADQAGQILHLTETPPRVRDE